MLVAVASGVVLLSCALAAHHANAVFDLGKRLTLTGTVTEWFWANPHCLLRFDVKNDSGEMMHWVAETQAPPNMTPFGWTKQSFAVGDQVTVTLEPVKNGSPLGRILQVKLPDGKTLVAGNGLPPSDGSGARP
ncbi:MAG: hypothetical protein DMF88_12480 [Acidobacteria bacterium]|nr:MAG: hypothetical protein DMF88_12480 [Acidobacteriota bacterium]